MSPCLLHNIATVWFLVRVGGVAFVLDPTAALLAWLSSPSEGRGVPAAAGGLPGTEACSAEQGVLGQYYQEAVSGSVHACSVSTACLCVVVCRCAG